MRFNVLVDSDSSPNKKVFTIGERDNSMQDAQSHFTTIAIPCDLASFIVAAPDQRKTVTFGLL